MTKKPFAKTDFLEKARTAWNGNPPAWVEEVARAINQTSQREVAKRVGVSASLISYLLANKYKGDFDRIEARVRGAFMNALVDCPVLGEIGLDQCLDEQAKPFAATSSVRTRVYRACRSGCPHSRLKRD